MPRVSNSTKVLEPRQVTNSPPSLLTAAERGSMQLRLGSWRCLPTVIILLLSGRSASLSTTLTTGTSTLALNPLPYPLERRAGLPGSTLTRGAKMRPF